MPIFEPSTGYWDKCLWSQHPKMWCFQYPGLLVPYAKDIFLSLNSDTHDHSFIPVITGYCNLSISQIASIPFSALKPLAFYLTVFVQYIYPFEKSCLPLPSHILPSCLKIKAPWFMKINRIFCSFTSWILPGKIQIWLSPTLSISALTHITTEK